MNNRLCINWSNIWNLFFRKKTAGILLAVVAITYILTIFPAKTAYAGHEEQDRVYKSVMIQSGDTLWSIAVNHYDKNQESVEDYISLIKRCNNLYSDQITYGCYLIIPQYE